MSTPERHPLVRRIVLGVLVFVGLWVLFFDTHNLLQRARWTYELHETQVENARLQDELEVLQEQLESVDAPDVVEQVAREQYGMRRPGETVYPLSR